MISLIEISYINFIIFLFFSVFSSLFKYFGQFYLIFLALSFSIHLYIFFLKTRTINMRFLYLLIIFFYLTLIAIFIGIIAGYSISIMFNNSKFLFMLLFIPLFLEFEERGYGSKLLSMFSFIVLIKLLFIFFIIIDQNTFKYFKNLIIHTDIKVVKFFSFNRIFDKAVVYLPAAYLIIHNKKMIKKVSFNLISFSVIISSGTTSFYLSFFLFLLLLHPKSMIFLLLIIMIYFNNDLLQLLNNFIEYKKFSIGVKNLQIEWLFSNFEDIFLFGKGLGYRFVINERSDFILENIYIYIWGVYGFLLGNILIFILLVLPIYIYIKLPHNTENKYLFLLHEFIMLNSIFNPFILTITSMFPFSYLFSRYIILLKNVNSKKIELRVFK